MAKVKKKLLCRPSYITGVCILNVSSEIRGVESKVGVGLANHQTIDNNQSQ